MRESKIESAVTDHAKSLGWVCFKFISGTSGVPDRVYIRKGVVLFVEFKATGKKPRKLQIYVINKMIKAGAKVYVIDSIEKGKELFNAHQKRP